jgi:hypothetical protein
MIGRMIRSIDWTITGLSTGVAVLAAAVGYEAFVLISSDSAVQPPKQYQLASVSSSVLIPARDRPPALVNATPAAPPAASAPVVVFAPSPAPSRLQGANSAEALLSPPPDAAPAAKRWDAAASAGAGSYNNYPPPSAAGPTAQWNSAMPGSGASNDDPGSNAAGPTQRRNSAMAGSGAQGFNDYPPPIPSGRAKRPPPPMPGPMGEQLNGRPPRAEYASLPRTEGKPAVPPMATELWRVETTAKANYFNLGGHVDKDGVVDSLASSYLRDALKKHRNYPKLPPQIKAYLDAPTINLARIAGYRAMLGIDDRKMEDEQGVKFVRVASRGVDLTTAGAQPEEPAAGDDVPPLDLNPLERMLSASREK